MPFQIRRGAPAQLAQTPGNDRGESPSVVPSNVLQKAAGPGWPVWVGMASWEPLSSRPPDAL